MRFDFHGTFHILSSFKTEKLFSLFTQPSISCAGVAFPGSRRSPEKVFFEGVKSEFVILCPCPFVK